MPKYRKLPVIIDAIQFDGPWAPIMAWLDELAGGKVNIPIGSVPNIQMEKDNSLSIWTLEGTMRADIGDYLICGVKGEFYPCKPNIFEATYEKVE